MDSTDDTQTGNRPARVLTIIPVHVAADGLALGLVIGLINVTSKEIPKPYRAVGIFLDSSAKEDLPLGTSVNSAYVLNPTCAELLAAELMKYAAQARMLAGR